MLFIHPLSTLFPQPLWIAEVLVCHSSSPEAAFWIQIATLFLMAGGIIATLCVSTREMKNANEKALEQSRNSFFAEYTRRYHDIFLAMPDEVFLGAAPAEGATLKYMQLYFDLCSEE